jgi:uncharacterized protein (DUF2147 family)
MKLIATIFFIFFLQIGLSQTVVGKWKTVDDITGKEKGIVEIYEKNGKFYGKIVEIFEAQHKNRKCEKCTGEDKDKPYLGLVIIKGLKTYRCKIYLDGKDKLIVRGYIGIPLIGRSQTWYRVK